jgi:hypothetical protein
MVEISKVYEKHDSEELQGFFNRCPWEWMFTGTSEVGTDLDLLGSRFARWRTIAAKATGLQIAVMGVLTNRPQPHLHGLLVGRNRHNKTLADVGYDVAKDLQNVWHNMSHRSSEISQIYDLGAARYIVTENLLYNPTAQMLSPINLKLIKMLTY